MSADLHDLLDRGVSPRPSSIDGDALVARGRRRRATKRAGAGVAALGLFVVVGASVLNLGEQPEAPVIAPAPGAVDVTWERTSDAPVLPRTTPTVATDGDRALFWSGETNDRYVETSVDGSSYLEVILQDGVVYDHSDDSWTEIPASPLSVRGYSVARLAGDTVLVFGGRELSPVGGGGVISGPGEAQPAMDGAVYDLTAERWTTIPTAPLSVRSPAVVDWDGATLLVWGGETVLDGPTVDGAVWTADRGWRAMTTSPLSARTGSAVAWDETRLVVWGGGTNLDPASGSEELYADGAMYDRATDSWTMLAPNELGPRWFSSSDSPTAYLDDERFVVVGGATTTPLEYFREGAALDLATGTWSPTATVPASARFAEPGPTGGYAADDQRTDDLTFDAWLYLPEDDRWMQVDHRTYSALHTDRGAAYDDRIIGALGSDGAWRPVTLALTDGTTAAPALRERGGEHRSFAATANLDSGVLLWGGQLDQRTDGGFTSDGRIPEHGWFLPFP